MTSPPESVLQPPVPRFRTSSEAHQQAIVWLVCVGMFMTTLDASIVNIGLPSIARAFGAPIGGSSEWVIIGYLVAIGALLLTFGRVSDMVGRPPVWTAGLIVFTLGSGMCGAAPSLGLLVAARAVQGIGAALMLATSTAILTDAVPASKRGQALGWSSVAIALGTSAGPTLGGLITEHLTWRWIFYVNVPLGIGALVATRRILPRGSGRGWGRLDPAGAVLLGLGIAALNLGLSFGERWGWSSPRLLSTLALGAGSLGVAVRTEARIAEPVIDLSLFRSRVFVSALASMVCSMLALFAVSFLLPFYLEELRGLSTAHSGMLLTPLPLGIAAVAPAAGRLADRLGSRWLAPLGLATTAVGLALLARLDATSSIWDVASRLLLTGLGQGLFLSPNTRALMDAAPAARQGEASALFATARVTGQALSVAIAGAVFTSLGGAAAGSALLHEWTHGSAVAGAAAASLQTSFVYAFHTALSLCATFAAFGALIALIRKRES